MSARVYIGRLSYRASERDIERFFRGFGRLTDVVLKNGFGFVEFYDVRDAEDAVYELNGRELCGERVVLEFSRRGPRSGGGGGFDRYDRFPPRRGESRYGPPVQTRHRVLVQNLSSRISWQDLKDMMRSVGEVTFADAHKERPNEGVVCFSSREGLERAFEKLQGKEVNGRKLKLIDDSERKSSRSRSRSRHRSRSRSRSRSSRSRSASAGSRGGSARKEDERSKSRSRSASARSRSRSRTRSPSAGEEESPRRNGGDAGDVGDDAMNHEERSRTPTPN